MNKPIFDAMVAQYAVKEASGEGVASWDGGVRCVLPEVLIGGKAIQNGTPTPDAPVMPEFSAGTTVQCGDTVAVAPELLAIPGTEYRDEWNPQTGKGVRRVSKLVLDGTETRWTATNRRVFDYNVPFASYAVNSSDDVIVSPIVCSHYGAISHYHANMNIQHGVSFYQKALSFSFGDGEVYTVDTWKAYLADQYAAGTPVTVWYALKEPVPFETEPQPLIAPKGTGHIIQVGGTLDAVPITAKYVTHS